MHGYDVIGDIHGHGAKLRGLLDQLGYVERDGVSVHPDRTAIFVGDFVDRGPQQLEVLSIVRAMVEAGSALAVMGNHEFNALAYNTEHPSRPGEYLRPHTDKNAHDHGAFLSQLDEAARHEWCAWFATLPLFLDLGVLRVVHACWHEPTMQWIEGRLGGSHFRSVDDLVAATDKVTPDELYEAIEIILKGPEIDLEEFELPAFLDSEGNVRRRARFRWWDQRSTTLDRLVVMPGGTTTVDKHPYPNLSEVVVAPDHAARRTYEGTVPVVYGHYWRDDEPTHLEDWTATTACVDFSAGKHGPLVAYRWSGETVIDVNHYVPNGPDIVASREPSGG